MAGDDDKAPVIDLTASDNDLTPKRDKKTVVIELDDEPEVLAVKLQPGASTSQAARQPLSRPRTISPSGLDLFFGRIVKPPKRPSSLAFTIPDEPKVIKPAAPTAPAASAPPVKKCPICLGALENPSSTICGHIFCTPCIRAAYNSNKICPVCRKKLKNKDIHVLYF